LAAAVPAVAVAADLVAEAAEAAAVEVNLILYGPVFF
jgi:hypothetical protein